MLSKESSVNSILYSQNYLEPNKWSEYVRRNAVNSVSEELPSVVKHEHEIQLEETTYEFSEIAAEEEYGQEIRLHDNEELRVTKSIGSVCDSTIVAKKEMSQSIIDFLIDIDSKTKLNVNNFNTGLNSVNEISTKDTMTIPMLQQAPTGFTEETKQSFMELELLVMSSEEKEEADFYCKLCEAYFPDNLMLTSHKNTSHITVKLKCQFCDIQFENSNQLNEHKQIHSNIFIECPVCGKMVHKGSSFKQHFLLHRDLNLHVCYKCGQVLPNETELESHKYLDHKVKNCLCETCGKVFKNKYTLSNHIKNHLGQAYSQKLKCGLCELWVSSRANLRHHTLTHNIFRERKHACDQCDKKFFYPHNLRAHVLVHFEDRPFKCTSCNKAFKWKKNLDLHMKTHLIVTDEPNKPVLKNAENKIQLCQICGKTLLSKTSLYTHLKSHDGSLKTICEICGKILSNSHVMQYHLDYHKRIDDAKSFSSKSSPANVLRNVMTNTSSFLVRFVLSHLEASHLCDSHSLCTNFCKIFRQQLLLTIHLSINT
uniref:(California timema) hypothetical protein n=1 Tax=Timema californicum TaxID=61474 RepID=A0A7R9IWS8_TIMCA|nr:unnamed protein product [Timema californicum]